MPKLSWAGDEDELLTADDIDGAEEGYQSYAGDVPPGGVYRFRLGRLKFKEASTGSQGLNVRLTLDGSWKREHRKYDGAPLWDTIWMTKGSASFVKAFCQAIGISGADITSRVVVDEDGYVTKIGKKTADALDGFEVYVAVKRDTYNDEVRIIKAGTGYQLVDTDDDDEDEEEAPAPARKSAPAKAAKAKAKPEPEEDEDEDDEDEPPARPAKKSSKPAAKKTSGAKGRRRDDDDEPPF